MMNFPSTCSFQLPAPASSQFWVFWPLITRQLTRLTLADDLLTMTVALLATSLWIVDLARSSMRLCVLHHAAEVGHPGDLLYRSAVLVAMLGATFLRGTTPLGQ